jgi:stage II sporulation protein D
MPSTQADANCLIRVLLLDDVNSFTLRVDSAWSIASDASNDANKVSIGANGKAITVTVDPGHVRIDGRIFTDVELTIQPEPTSPISSGAIFEVDGLRYRGFVKIKLNPDARSVDVINRVPVESYLAGVIGAEMPRYWEPEALKAQAIAARTYCLYVKDRFGSAREWDVRRTEAHQVYRGVAAEAFQIWAAVGLTEGMALVRTQADGSEAVFPAYYGSTCGGHTEDAMNVFGGAAEGIIGVPCSYCESVAKPRFFLWPMVQFDKSQVASRLQQRYPKLAQLGQLTDIVIAQKSDYPGFSRATRIDIIGSSGVRDWLRAEDFRLAVDPTGRILKSTSFEIADLGDKWGFLYGRGYGHGVGMCQCGAEGMARRGMTAEQILAYYYPGSKVVKIY